MKKTTHLLSAPAIAISAALGVAFGAMFGLTSEVSARDQIRIVGSSTVFPFSTAVAEEFGQKTTFKTPVVESTGSGGGLKLFCAGVGKSHPDITNASRKIKSSEIKKCASNGITEITEVKIGYDGIVIANSNDAPVMELTLQHVWLALGKEVPSAGVKGGALTANPFKNWSDIDPALPNTKIEVLGPPPTSGTRDAFAELALEGGCKTFSSIKDLKKSDKNRYKALCHTIREDGAYVEAGENDNLIVSKLRANPDALGVFGFSFLEQNKDSIHACVVNGVAPEFESISDGSYPISRSMYFYVKNVHVGSIPGINEYVLEFTDEESWGPYGYLVDKGLIPLAEDIRESARASAASLTPMTN